MLMLARALTALVLPLVLALSLLLGAAPLSVAVAKGRKAAPQAPLAAEILIDAGSGAVLRARNADRSTYPASLTKMMTLMLTFEALDQGKLRLGQPLPVSRHAASMPPSRLSLAPGGSITVEQAILALVTRSANDVAVVLAEALGGSEAAFAKRMTSRARALGMRHTVFRNASGLPNGGQRTTARDMATLSRALIRQHGRHYAYFHRRSFDWQGETVYGHNRLMARYPGMDGIKTGYIAASGFNLAASAVRDGRRLIAVVLGGRSADARDDRVADLLDDGFLNYAKLASTERPEKATRRSRDTAGIVVTTGSASTAQRSAALSVPAVKPAFGERQAGAARAPGLWSIQVGAFRSRAAAQRSAQATVARLGALAAGANAQIVHAGGFYKARLSGLPPQTADAACSALKAARHGCFTIRTP